MSETNFEWVLSYGQQRSESCEPTRDLVTSYQIVEYANMQPSDHWIVGRAENAKSLKMIVRHADLVVIHKK